MSSPSQWKTVLLLPLDIVVSSCCSHLYNLVHLQPSFCFNLLRSGTSNLSPPLMIWSPWIIFYAKFNNEVIVCIFDGFDAILMLNIGQKYWGFFQHTSVCCIGKPSILMAMHLKLFSYPYVYPQIITKLLSVARYKGSTLLTTAM